MSNIKNKQKIVHDRPAHIRFLSSRSSGIKELEKGLTNIFKAAEIVTLCCHWMSPWDFVVISQQTFTNVFAILRRLITFPLNAKNPRTE